jgi:hypothetical protein
VLKFTGLHGKGGIKMIVRPNKTYETNSNFLKSNWYENEPDNFIVDETTKKGSALAEKIKRLYPYYDFVLDAKGNLVNVIETERPPAPPKEPSLEERITSLETEVAKIKELIKAP